MVICSALAVVGPKTTLNSEAAKLPVAVMTDAVRRGCLMVLASLF
jgi:hypothetical protein